MPLVVSPERYSRCFQGGNKAQTHLKPRIAHEILQAHKDRVVALLQRESTHPLAHTKVYDKYTFLINRQVS